MNIYGMTLEQLEDYFISIGQKKFKATQVYDWLYKKRVTSFDDMSNIKKDVIDILNGEPYVKKDGMSGKNPEEEKPDGQGMNADARVMSIGRREMENDRE